MTVPPPPPSTATALAAAVRHAVATAPELRWYQAEVKAGIYENWETHRNVLAVLPTGGGKTVLFASVIYDHQGAACAVAHRRELVAQISQALARNGIKHRIIAPDKVVRAICAAHMEELGVCYHWASAPVSVAAIDTLLGRGIEQHRKHLDQVTLWVQDEAHHVLKANKWGKVVDLFPRAKGLGVTATPGRADGKGLGSHSDGVFDVMVLGPNMRTLIDQGYLTDYRLIVAETHIDMAGVSINKEGDYVLSQGAGKAAVRGSTLVGDVVKTYMTWCPGALGVCFASDIDTSEDIAQRFRDAGIPAEAVDGATEDGLRAAALRRFARRETLVLVNVDLFGEGFDLPAIEVVMMARKTLSRALFDQQAGRALRLMLERAILRQWDRYAVAERLQLIAGSKKPKALIIDHVGNAVHHGLPDVRNDWTLDARTKRGKGGDDAEARTACLNPACLAVYPRVKPCCPYCGTKPEPRAGARSPIEAVDGNMFELSPEFLAALRGQQAENFKTNDEVRREFTAQGLPSTWVLSQVKKHDAKRQAAENLRDAMAWWAGEKRADGQSDVEIYKRFYLTFGVDWISACGQDREAMATLAERVDEKLTPASSALRIRATA